MQSKYPVLTLSVLAAAALVANRAVTAAGTVPGAGARCLGFTNTAAGIGDRVPLDAMGTTIAEAGGSFAAGAGLELDASGRVVTLASGVQVGHALEASGGVGKKVEILLIPN